MKDDDFLQLSESNTTCSISANSSDECKASQTFKSVDETSSTQDDIHSFKAPITPLDNIPYIHRGFSGAAPFFTEDKKWMLILQHLMPEEYHMLICYLESKKSIIDPIKLIKWAENNPIVCAFGVLESKTSRIVNSGISSVITHQSSNNEYSSNIAKSATINKASGVLAERLYGKEKREKKIVHPTIEWDVFLDPSIVKQVDGAIHTMEKLGSDSQEDEIVAAQIEIDRQITRLMNRMMLAHGSTAQLLVEAVGVATRYSFSRFVNSTHRIKKTIKKNRSFSLFRTKSDADDASTRNDISSPRVEEAAFKNGNLRSNAIRVDRWLVLFSKALRLGKKSLGVVLSLTKQLPRLESTRAVQSNIEARSLRSKASRFLRRSKTLTKEDLDDESIVSVSTAAQDQDFVSPALCGLFLCLGLDDPSSFMVDHSDKTIAESCQIIRSILGSNLQIVLDMKSRHVPPRVWAMLVDCLQSRGLDIKGIGSFDLDELRSIQSCVNTPVNAMIFFHSAGDLQRACHANEIKDGDNVYFNAGSLMWKRKTACEVTGQCFSASKYQGLEQVDFQCGNEYSPFQPYAYPRDQLEASDEIMDCKACIQDYQRHFDLNIGLYLHEFDIGVDEIDAMSKFVNRYSDIYRLGLAWGGLNGFTLRGLKGDGLWSQRYVGRAWDFEARPHANMTLLAPEDHHFVQRIVFPCGNVATTNHIDDDDTFFCQHGPILDFTKTGNM